MSHMASTMYLDRGEHESLKEGRETKVYCKELGETIYIKPPSTGLF
jgi:hypothetical protein